MKVIVNFLFSKMCERGRFILSAFLLTLLISTAAVAEEDVLEKLLGKIGTGAYISLSVDYPSTQDLSYELSGQSSAANDGTYKYKLKGYRFGAQLGYMFGKVVAGLERTIGTPNYQYTNPSGGTIRDASLDTFIDTAFLMYRGEYWVSWAGVIFGGGVEDASNSMKYGGILGTAVGIGYKLADWLQINVHSRTYSFSTTTTSGVETKLPSTTQTRVKGNEILVGISVPFELKGKKGSKRK